MRRVPCRDPRRTGAHLLRRRRGHYHLVEHHVDLEPADRRRLDDVDHGQSDHRDHQASDGEYVNDEHVDNFDDLDHKHDEHLDDLDHPEDDDLDDKHDDPQSHDGHHQTVGQDAEGEASKVSAST